MSRRSVYILLTDMLDAIEATQEFTRGIDYKLFLNQRIIRDAVVRNIQIMGEAASRIPVIFRDEHPDIEWTRIIRTRHILVHDYFGLDYEILWRIVTVHLPALHQAIKHVIDTEPLANADSDLD